MNCGKTLTSIVLAGALTFGATRCSNFENRMDGKLKGYNIVTFTDGGGRHLIIGDFYKNKHGHIVPQRERGEYLEANDFDEDGKFEVISASPEIFHNKNHPLNAFAQGTGINDVYKLLFVKN